MHSLTLYRLLIEISVVLTSPRPRPDDMVASSWEPFSLCRSEWISDKLHVALYHTLRCAAEEESHEHERGSISCCATPTPTCSAYSLNRCFIGIILTVCCVSAQINNADSSRKTRCSIWTQSGAICGALQLCDEQSGDGERDVEGATGACGLTNEYPGGFSLIVGEE